MDNIRYYKTKDDIIEIFFQYTPSNAILSTLKKNRWKWNPDKICWYNHLNKESLMFAKQLGAFDASSTHKITPQHDKSVINNKKLLSDLRDIGCNETDKKKIDSFLYNLIWPYPNPCSHQLKHYCSKVRHCCFRNKHKWPQYHNWDRFIQ